MKLFGFLRSGPPPQPKPTQRSTEYAASVLDHLSLLQPEEPLHLRIKAKFRLGDFEVFDTKVPTVGPHPTPEACTTIPPVGSDACPCRGERQLKGRNLVLVPLAAKVSFESALI
jgi:hypothetical protein